MKKFLIIFLLLVLFGCSTRSSVGELDLGPVVTDYVLGNFTAPVQIVEYTDFQCQFCGDFHRDIFPLIKSNYIDTNKVSYVLKDFPLISIHKQSFDSSKATYCAGDQGKYWQMVDHLFANQQSLEINDLIGYASAVGVDNLEKFETCLLSQKYNYVVEDNLVDGANGGIQGPPSFFINEIKISGGQEFEVFSEIIDRELARF